MDGDALTRSLQDFLAESPEAVVVEGGEVIFDFTTAKYACRAEHGKCLLHLWSEERNTVRRILDIEIKCGFTQKVKLGSVKVKLETSKRETPLRGSGGARLASPLEQSGR
jgi:hypothetical protein